MLTKKDSLKSEVKNSKSSRASLIEQESAHAPTSTPSPSLTKPSKAYNPTTSLESTKISDSSHSSDRLDKREQKTRIKVKYDVGFNNQLYIRGKGANLSWDKGSPLKNIKADEWTWETDLAFSQCEFKVLINDRQYELGENHHLTNGMSVVYTPKF